MLISRETGQYNIENKIKRATALGVAFLASMTLTQTARGQEYPEQYSPHTGGNLSDDTVGPYDIDQQCREAALPNATGEFPFPFATSAARLIRRGRNLYWRNTIQPNDLEYCADKGDRTIVDWYQTQNRSNRFVPATTKATFRHEAFDRGSRSRPYNVRVIRNMNCRGTRSLNDGVRYSRRMVKIIWDSDNDRYDSQRIYYGPKFGC